MRLIDADNLLTAFPPEEDETFHTSAVRGTINACQTVDAVPVRHGQWIRIYSRPGVFKYLGWTCDQCGQRTGNEYAPQWYKFCPNCGARMDGKDGKEVDEDDTCDKKG